METGTDEFLEYLNRRLTHHKTRLEKVSKYRSLEPSQLNADQLNSLADSEKSEGKCEETKFLKDKYKIHLDAHKEQHQQELHNAREQGRTEACNEFAEKLQLISLFLNSMSNRYKQGKPPHTGDRESYAFFKLLQQFYLGDDVGATAMANFVDGVESDICDSGVKFSELKLSLLSMNEQVGEPHAIPTSEDATSIAPQDEKVVVDEETEEKVKSQSVNDETTKSSTNSKPKLASSSPHSPSPVPNGRSIEQQEEWTKQGSEPLSRQNSMDQFQIVGSKNKDKLKPNPRRKNNTKKKQPRSGKSSD